MEIEILIKKAMENRASDLHLTVARPPMIRVDGELIKLCDEVLTPNAVEELAMNLLSEKLKLEVLEKGEVDFAYSLPGIGRFRANIYKQRGTYAMAIRLLPFSIPDPYSLGIPDCVIDMTNRKRGLVLVTGSTGSGKSTTLSALIDTINHKCASHIITLEDPIEYLHRHDKSIVNQREMGIDTLSYANGLRAALRQDPDVILVGEMRDYETISTAITAAETGHLVFSTLHTNGVVHTIDRIIDVFPPNQQQQIRVQLATVLECVVSQQLIPTKDNKGRVAAFEVMLANLAIRNLIRESKTFQITSIIQTNKEMGMQTMDDAILDLYSMNKISKEMAINFAVNPANLSRRLM